MVKLLFLLFLLPMNAFSKDWKCSNWKPVFSPILVYTGARSNIVRLSEPTTDLKVAKQNQILINKNLQGVSKALNYELESIIVRSNNSFQVVLTECWTQTEAASILLKLEGKGQLENFKIGSYQEVTSPDCIHCGK